MVIQRRLLNYEKNKDEGLDCIVDCSGCADLCSACPEPLAESADQQRIGVRSGRDGKKECDEGSDRVMDFSDCAGVRSPEYVCFKKTARIR